MEWNSSFIEDINRRRKQERESAPDMARRHDSLLMLTSRSLYGEKVHYALELIQNAEDANSSSITFIFEKDKVIVANDGGVFSPDDVEALCSVEPGRKKNKIGFFGVGFKSVFNITNAPQVISSDFNFVIENYICPKPVSHLADELKPFYSKEKGSIFVFPQSEGLPTIAELVENFKEIDDKILLFLNKVRSLHFIDNVNSIKWSIEKLPTEDSLILLKDGRTNQISKWRVFHKDLTVSKKAVSIPEGKEGITETRIIVAFPWDEKTMEINKASTVYCYLPTNKRSDMPFLVQADFVPTVGRGNIQDLEWNRWLLREHGELAAEAVEQLKDEKIIGENLYSFIPLKDEIQESLMDILSDSMYKILTSKRIASTLSLQWERPNECAIAKHPEITKIITEEDLKVIFGKPLSYADIALPERARHILTELGSSNLREKEFVEFLNNESLIKSRNPSWFLKVYAYLSKVFDVQDKYYGGSFKWDDDKLALFSKLEKTKFILTNQGGLVPLKDPLQPDRLICYPQSIDLSEVNELFTEGEFVFLNRYFQLSTILKRKETDPKEEDRRKKAHGFFEGIGVKIYFKQSHVIKDVILPKYASGKYKDYDDLKRYKLLNYIRTYWSTLESEVRNKKLSENIFDEISQTVLLKAYTKKNGEKIITYKSPDKLYFPKRYGNTEVMEDLFEGLEEVHFLHPYYLNRERTEKKKTKRGRQKPEYGWKRFAEILGVWSSPRAEKENKWVSITGRKEYDWVEKKYSPQRVHEIYGDSTSEDIQRLIRYCSILEDPETTRRKMTVLWQSLSDNWKNYKAHCAATYKYFHYTDHQENLPSSSFLTYLRGAKWIPTTDEGFCKPGEAFVESTTNRLLLGDTVKFVKLPGSQTFLKDIGVNLEPSTEQVIEHLVSYKENMPQVKKSKIEKFKIIYSFLAEKIDEQDVDKGEMLEKIRKQFEEKELLYLPRKDRFWWNPRLVFWRDYSSIFGPLRAYVEHEEKEIYPSGIKKFMSALGVRERPSIKQALEVLEELRRENNIGALKKIVTKIYHYISSMIINEYEEKVDWNKYYFFTKDKNFCQPASTYFDDDEEYAKEFYGKVEFIYLPFSSWINVRPFLESAGFKGFAKSLSVKKYLDDISEVEGGKVAAVVRVLIFVKSYLLNKNLELYERLTSEGVFEKLESIEIYKTSQIKLDLFLEKEGAETIIIRGLVKEAYYSDEENRLYVSDETILLSPKVAKELSRIFKGAENEVFPLLSSILPKADDEEAFTSQLQLFGISMEEETYSGAGEVEFLPEEEKIEEEEVKEEKTIGEETEKEEKKVKPPSGQKPLGGLIDPDAYYCSTGKSYAQYKKTEGKTPKIVKEIKLKLGKKGTSGPEKRPKSKMGTLDAENIAIQIVINHEADEGRTAEDRHKQRGIGYDVYSKKNDGEEMFIEVKHFRDQEGKFGLTPHQLEKAKKEGDKYYVYIVTGLKEEASLKKLIIIQNPLRWLTPDPPVEAEYSDWRNAVKEEFELEKA